MVGLDVGPVARHNEFALAQTRLDLDFRHSFPELILYAVRKGIIS